MAKPLSSQEYAVLGVMAVMFVIELYFHYVTDFVMGTLWLFVMAVGG